MIFGSWRYSDCLKTLAAFSPEEVPRVFALLEDSAREHYAVGYVRYDLSRPSAQPLVWFQVFAARTPYTPPPANPPVLRPQPALSFAEYARAIDSIKRAIAAGDTYEVNYTCDFTFPFAGDPRELFAALAARQPVPYQFYCANEYETILSFSPELFFSKEADHVTMRPMKGTIRRGTTPTEDAELKDFLRNDPKNRAENAMIADLVRHDLGRVARTGSVKATTLFAVETHPTLHQMTSTIEADLRPNTSLYELFSAVFPCGSITGAPKKRTLEIIRETEKGDRGVYCGAIGVLEPGGRALFSVPIRTLQRRAGAPCWTYRAGGAVVWDSDARGEWDEMHLKTAFLRPNFQLLETLKVENGRILFLREHLARLEAAARHFGFPYAPPEIGTPPDGMLRILLDTEGRFTIESRPLAANPLPARAVLSETPVDPKNEFLFYKSTWCPWYAADRARIAQGDVFDVLHVNTQGELTEGARSNIVLELDGRLYTPPVSCGLLGGVGRADLLARGICTERVLTKDDLRRATRVFCVNSVRGLVEVHP